jgi:hypothetical protein
MRVNDGDIQYGEECFGGNRSIKTSKIVDIQPPIQVRGVGYAQRGLEEL